MTTIGVIGLGHMGRHMAQNLLVSHRVIGFDLNQTSLDGFVAAGGSAAASIAALAREADVVVTSLPKGTHVQSVFLGPDGVIENAGPGKLFIDCSTIDLATSREVAELAGQAGSEFIDAPVSGGETGATAGTLSFMVGGTEAAFERAKPVLAKMGTNLYHVGDNGSGLAVKLVNNMLLGICMAATGEALNLIEHLGVDPAKFHAIASTSTGANWALTKNPPVAGLVDGAPASNDFRPGFASALMLKDLGLSQTVASDVHAPTPLGALAHSIYSMVCGNGLADEDMSAVIKLYSAPAETR
ncbi:3-hydroxyisobutyrate dehydrogenase [Streptomyces sioyaensis]|uniref:3-hydroxyisobutyrate dehydrogenase n=1 Tax=Streptomyces sioyaensis TaxID=67364 RepID=UPI0037D6108D